MIAALLLLPLLIGPAEAAPPLGEARRVLVLGDSITAAGRYTAYLEGYFATRFPGREIAFLNLGLPSETVSGLSEPMHPYPRPNVHERLERALAKVEPDVVVACYGMNDGIYAPFSEARLAKYQDGLLKLVSRCREGGLRVYLVTSPPFDPDPVRKILRTPNATEFGWTGPYFKYEEEVLARYGAWVKTLEGVGFTAIDAHSPILAHLAKARREGEDYRLAGDGVHLDASGHWLIAQAILEAWKAPSLVDRAEVDAKSLTVALGDVGGLKAEAGGLRFSWTTRIPMPHDPEWNAKLSRIEGIDARLNRHLLVVAGLDGGPYTVYEGNRSLGRASRAELAEGLDLLKFPELSTNRRAAELGKLVLQRERLLSPAWLDHVGHKRPDTAKGLSIDEATKRSEPITAEIKRLAKPIPVELRIVP